MLRIGIVMIFLWQVKKFTVISAFSGTLLNPWEFSEPLFKNQELQSLSFFFLMPVDEYEKT